MGWWIWELEATLWTGQYWKVANLLVVQQTELKLAVVTVTDNEPPVFQNCPQQPIIVQKGPNGLEPVNFTEPVAVDNSGSIARLEVKPQSFRTPIQVFHDMVVKYVAFDYDGNVAICEINITVPGKFWLLYILLPRKWKWEKLWWWLNIAIYYCTFYWGLNVPVPYPLES